MLFSAHHEKNCSRLLPIPAPLEHDLRPAARGDPELMALHVTLIQFVFSCRCSGRSLPWPHTPRCSSCHPQCSVSRAAGVLLGLAVLSPSPYLFSNLGLAAFLPACSSILLLRTGSCCPPGKAQTSDPWLRLRRGSLDRNQVHDSVTAA